MKTDSQRLEDMVRIAKEGIVIGVLFNDQELYHLEKQQERVFQEAYERFSQEAAVKYPNIEGSVGQLGLGLTRSEYARREAFIESRPLFESATQRWGQHSRRVNDSFFNFLQENQARGYTSHPQESRYDKNLHLESVDLGVRYALHARKEFPGYSFILTEALTEDKNENFIAHSNITVV